MAVKQLAFSYTVYLKQPLYFPHVKFILSWKDWQQNWLIAGISLSDKKGCKNGMGFSRSTKCIHQSIYIKLCEKMKLWSIGWNGEVRFKYTQFKDCREVASQLFVKNIPVVLFLVQQSPVVLVVYILKNTSRKTMFPNCNIFVLILMISFHRVLVHASKAGSHW